MNARSFILICLSTVGFSAQAENLLAVYQDAVKSDPIYHMAIETALASQTQHPQAKAALLPTVSGQMNWLKKKQTLRSQDSPALREHYTPNQNHLLTLTQPIYDPVNWALLETARWQAQKAYADIRAANQDLVVRTAAAYYRVLQAQDERDVASDQKKANARQLALAKQRHQAGLEAITAVYDAQARYDSAQAVLIQANTAIEDAKEALRQITGRYYSRLSALRNTGSWLRRLPDHIDRWVLSAKAHNPLLQAAYYASLAQKNKIKASEAAHMPVVTVSGTIARQGAHDRYTGLADSQVVGVGMQIPIFEGGLVLQKTRQAQHEYQASLNDEDRIRRQVLAQVHQAYNHLLSGVSMIKADKQGVFSANKSLESNEAAYKVGTRTMIDVLIAESNVSEAKRRLAADTYQYFNAVLNLKQAAGTLSIQDLFKLNEWLQP